MTEESNWYVYYTKSRAEKRTKELLEKNGFETFLPLNKVVRQWSDRKKKVEVPLFNSYIFVNTPDHKIQEVLQIPGIAWSIRHDGKPVFLRHSDKKIIEKLLSSGYVLNSHMAASDFNLGDHVKIIDGTLKGTSGVVMKKDRTTIFVSLNSISQVVSLEVSPDILEKI